MIVLALECNGKAILKTLPIAVRFVEENKISLERFCLFVLVLPYPTN